MDGVVRRDILRIGKTLLRDCARTKVSSVALKVLSNDTIRNASLFQDEDSLSIAILTYSLSKIVDRQGYLPKGILPSLKAAVHHLEKRDEDSYRNEIAKIFDRVKDADHHLRMYIIKIINQAEIKKGSKLYQQGLSIARAAALLGISQWELMGYVGKLQTPLSPKEKVTIQKRIAMASSAFGL
ncbi:MAG: hypothetical protein ABIH34_03085 [Nanoarchaeota archaeon]